MRICNIRSRTLWMQTNYRCQFTSQDLTSKLYSPGKVYSHGAYLALHFVTHCVPKCQRWCGALVHNVQQRAFVYTHCVGKSLSALGSLLHIAYQSASPTLTLWYTMCNKVQCQIGAMRVDLPWTVKL